MKIFEIQNNIPIVTIECLLVPEFKKIWKADKSKDKTNAFNLFCYIYFSIDYKSLYLSFDKETREERLLEDYIGDKNWKPTQDVLAAMKKYQEFQNTPTMRFLQDNLDAMESMGKYFRSIDWEETTEKGIVKYDITKVATAVKNAGGIIDNIEKLRDKVKKELSLEGSKARGAGTGGLLEFQ